ncbi:hypothetical protein ACFQ4M_19710 [Thauera mechernichensis]|uniref:Uncharacterized protein n=1 Tax=Thauera mechernichensis TaxID=82788 RepID=A0ABW3WL49_9RHOO|nr:hypothetical protein [Thauera mechernichensis]MDG3066874.1 hypothetical protein [Thauera mechernichensis]
MNERDWTMDLLTRRLARRMFFTEVPCPDGKGRLVLFNWLGRNAPFVVLGGWAALMLASALMRA